MKCSSEVETPNNFCPSIFSQMCSDLHFLQIANLDTPVQIFSSVSKFAFLMRIKFWTHLRKSRHLFCRKSIQEKIWKVCVYWFAFWRKCKCRHTWENLDRDTYVCVKIYDLKKMQIWTHLRKSGRTEIIGGFHLCS